MGLCIYCLNQFIYLFSEHILKIISISFKVWLVASPLCCCLHYAECVFEHG